MRYVVSCSLVLGLCWGIGGAPVGQPQRVGGKKTDKAAWLKAKPRPQWIWHKQARDGQTVYLRKSFSLSKKIKTAQLYTTCDNKLKLWINGKLVGTSRDWPYPVQKDVAQFLKPGTNFIAAECKNDSGPAGFVLKLRMTTVSGKELTIVSNRSWQLSTEEEPNWQSVNFQGKWNNKLVQAVGKLGRGPWGIPAYSKQVVGGGGNRLDPDNVTNLPGFQVDLVYVVPRSQGSWVSLATDSKGGFYASDQGGAGLFHITVDEDGKANVSEVPVQVGGRRLSGAQGLVWAYDSLWFHRNGGNLYRVTDSNKDGLLDKAEVMPGGSGGGEHGNHAVVITEDMKGLYLVGGNSAPLAALTRKRVQDWNEDHLLPRLWDARGHARGRLAPGGWITRFDLKTKTQELICSGFRNEYDVALNRYGDLFTYDSDMEWDLGLPWYRPTRICLAASGIDYGWRSGSVKWPKYFEDTLGPVVEIGPGSPTGVLAGIGAKFPAKYQDAIYALDWTFGTIYAIHLTPKGAGYTGEREAFVYGSPLPVTDAVIGQDGAMYFLIGGRGSQSAMFRVRYVGKESTEAGKGNDTPEAAKARELRRELEAFHGRKVGVAVMKAWPHLSTEDRFLRNAARVAIESQPVNQWADRVLTEENPQARITSAVALARMGSKLHRGRLLASLLELDPSKLTESQFLGLLRAYSLNFIRLGRPTDMERQQVIDKLDPHLPSQSDDLNTELLRVLTYLRAPSAIPKGIALIKNRTRPKIPDWTALAKRNPGYGRAVQRMIDNHPPSVEIGYAYLLRNLKRGWTLKQRRTYFQFLNQAAKGSGGASFPGYLTRIREEALGNCTNEERLALKDITGENFNPLPDFEIIKPKGPGRKWTVKEAIKNLRGKANFERGRSLFFSATCAKCHRLGGLGGDIGPDLTSLPNRFDQNYVVEAIIHPSKNISDQYGSSLLKLKNGKVLNGLVVEQGDKLKFYPIKADAIPTIISREDVVMMKDSPVSQMPTGLLDTLNPGELRDLVAYLMSGGNPRDRRFR
ncbi:MAG: c-type cytochrome [Gemmataceae bacterium]